MIFLSIVIPVFNDAEVLNELHRRLRPICENLTVSFRNGNNNPNNSFSYEIVFIDDGSTDASFSVLKTLRRKNENIKIIKLRKNFGQANAIAAGLENAIGKFIAIMDADLQDKPEDIPKLMTALQNSDASMAIASWSYRKTSLIRKMTSAFFWKFSNVVTAVKQPSRTGVFRVFKREAYEKVKKIADNCGTILSGFYQANIDYVLVELQRDKRFAGKSGYNLKKIFTLAFDRILPNLKIHIKKFERKPKFEIEEILDLRKNPKN